MEQVEQPKKRRNQDLGPAEPLFKPKLRNYRKCGNLSVNYFECPECIWKAKYWGYGNGAVDATMVED